MVYFKRFYNFRGRVLKIYQKIWVSQKILKKMNFSGFSIDFIKRLIFIISQKIIENVWLMYGKYGHNVKNSHIFK